jgi:integrase
MTDSKKRADNLPAAGGHLILLSGSTITDFPGKTLKDTGVLLPKRRKRAPKAMINGHLARRNPTPGTVDHVVWDTVLAGFGLQVRASGNNSWIVQYRQRGKLKKVTLGRCVDVDANDARARARTMLAAAALDGLPKRVKAKPVPLFKDYAGEFYANCFEQWKPATQASNRGAIERQLIPNFGDIPVNEIRKADIIRWRDSLSAKQGVFNRCIPVLSGMLQYAARLGYCRVGSNVSRGTPRYKRELIERYLTPMEYRRVAAALTAAEEANPTEVAILRLLVFTGARLSEITELKWSEVQPPRLQLWDSKSNAKYIYLNRQAEALLASVTRTRESELVFPNRSGSAGVNPSAIWNKVRRKALVPDVRLHDLRHSYASAGIMDAVPLATIGKLFGHALHETTARYAHVADGAACDAAQRVSGSIAGHLGLGR